MSRLVPALLLACPLATTPAAAAPGDEAVIDTCGPRAALYETEKGPKLWLVRQGAMMLAENPLRPLSRDRALVLDVVVNGRRATAWGLDYATLRQGGAPADVERLGSEPIRWVEGGTPRPPELRIVADDGTVVVGPLRFVECVEPPSAKPVAARRPDAEAKPQKPVPRERPASGLPQGALPSLNLPPGPAPR